MSYPEAVEDGIRIARNSSGKTLYYEPPCVLCGKPLRLWSYSRSKVYICSHCKAQKIRDEKKCARKCT